MAPLSDKTNDKSELQQLQESFRESFRASARKYSPLSDSEAEENDEICGSTTASGQSSLILSPCTRRQLSTMTAKSENPSYHDPASLQIAEVVFDVLKAEGIDLSTLPLCEKSFALQVDSNTTTLQSLVGREPQAGFFERMVPRKESLSCISRSHFEIRLEPGADAPVLRKLSRNPMHVNNVPIGGEDIELTDKSVLGFKGAIDWAPCFLNLCITFRNRRTVDLEGPHPSLTVPEKPSKTNMSRQVSRTVSSSFEKNAGIAAVLECCHSDGSSNLAAIAPDKRVIPLRLNESLEVGRNCQSELFADLFNSHKQTLWKMVSRRHCRVQLCAGEPPAEVDGAEMVELDSKGNRPMWLLVENLSGNTISVDGVIVSQGKSRIMPEGAKIAFVQTTNTEYATNFLAFRLRRARIVKGGGSMISS